MSPSSSSTHAKASSAGPLESLAEEYTRRIRAGEEVAIETYADAHPELADEIRSFFPTIAALERAASSGSRDDTAPPERIGEYDVVREIGRGGMGVVLLAEQTSLKRRVALKLLPPQASLDRRFLERFRREARAAARLQHPHIVQVFGVGEDQGLHFYAMQYIEGVALDRVVRALRRLEGGSPTETTDWAARALMRTGAASADVGTADRSTYYRNMARVAAEVAEALAYAHGNGVLHRDIKPANLLIDAKGTVWITDFGLCRTTEERDLSASRDMVGTLRYMAPEQIDGRADVRSDVYGLGATVYELLTLRAAFEEESRPRLIQSILTDAPVRPNRLAPDLPRDLEAIVLKALRKDPADRYETANAMADDLRAFLEERPVAARIPSALYLARLAVRRNKLLSATIGAALFLVVALTVVYVAGLRTAQEEQARQLYVASIAAAESALRTGNTAAAQRRLDAAPEELRGWEWAHFRSRLDESLAVLAPAGSPVGTIDVSPDGRFLAAGTPRGLVVWEPARSSAELPTSRPVHSNMPRVCFGPGGRLLAAGTDRYVRSSTWTGERWDVSERAFPIGVSVGRFHPEGTEVAVGLMDASIHILDPDLEQEHRVLTGKGGRPYDLAYDPSGEHIVAGFLDGSLTVWDLATDRSRSWQANEASVSSVAVSPDGRLIAAGGGDTTVGVWSLATGEELHRLRSHANAVRDVAFSPDGRHLVSSSTDRTIKVWDVRSGIELRTLHGHSRAVVGLAFPPGGERLVSGSADGTIREWDVATSGGLFVLRGHLMDIWSLAFDPSGDLLASVGRDCTVRLWDTRTGEEQRVLIGHERGVNRVRFSPDGRLLATGDWGGGILLWDVASGRELHHIEGAAADVFDRSDTVWDLRFDASGEKLLVASADGTVEVWRLDGTPEREHSVRADTPARSLAIDATRGRVAVGYGDGTLRIYDADLQELLHERREHEDDVSGLDFQPGGLLASVSYDRTLALWEPRAGELVARVSVEDPDDPFQASAIEGVVFLDGGRRLATASRSAVVTLWDTETVEEVIQLHGHEGSVSAIASGPGGMTLASATWTGDIRIWDTTRARDRIREASRERPLVGTPDVRERGTPAHLYRLCRDAVLRPDGSPADYRRAYSLAYGLGHAFVREERYRTARGAALFRCGQVEEGLEHLQVSFSLADTEAAPPLLCLFLAMSHARLGQLDEARAKLALGRERAARAPELRVLLREAEETVRAAEAGVDSE